MESVKEQPGTEQEMTKEYQPPAPKPVYEFFKRI